MYFTQKQKFNVYLHTLGIWRHQKYIILKKNLNPLLWQNLQKRMHNLINVICMIVYTADDFYMQVTYDCTVSFLNVIICKPWNAIYKPNWNTERTSYSKKDVWILSSFYCFSILQTYQKLKVWLLFLFCISVQLNWQ